MKGVVKRVIYANPDSGYAVLAVDFEGKQETVVGSLGAVSEGTVIEGEFEQVAHPKYGPQLKAVRVKVVQDTTPGAVAEWLAANVKGVGDVLAKRIMERVGERFERLGDASFLFKVNGVSLKVARAIAETWKERKEEAEELAALIDLGLSNAYAVRALKHFGTGVSTLVRENPYKLTKVPGIGFKLADEVAGKLGIRGDDPRRLEAAAIYALEEVAAKRGHTAPHLEAVLESSGAVNLTKEQLKRGLQLAAEAGDVVFEGDRVGLARYRKAEEVIRRFSRQGLAVGEDEAYLEAHARLLGKLTEQQAQVAKVLAKRRMAILTGGPGTGKSHTLAELVKVLSDLGLSVAVAAPTGKAAARLKKAGLEDAKTIHKLLGYKGDTWHHGPDNPLEVDLLVIDEASMVDVSLMRRVMEALSTRARLLLVGDANQLPSVGPGQVFHDLASGSSAVVRLDRVFRQAEDSPIVKAAYEVLGGGFPKAVEVKPADPEAVIEHAAKLWNAGVEVQVLTPMNRGPLGVHRLNQEIKRRVNVPGAPRWTFFNLGDGGSFKLPGGVEVHVGDPVIGTQDNYDDGIMNGEVGVVRAITEDSVLIDLGDRQVEMDRKGIGPSMLALAYAITVHRSQGSEWAHVLFALGRDHYIMANREIVYTAFTRAKLALEVFADRQIMAVAVKRRASARETWLKVWNGGAR